VESEIRRYEEAGRAVLFSAYQISTGYFLSGPWGAAKMHKGFIGHGIFIEGSPIGALIRYQGYKTAPSMLDRLMSMLPDALRPSPDPVALIGKFIKAMNDMAVKSVWLQLFNRHGEIDRDGKGATAQLVGALKTAGIVPVGWGYCYNKNATTDLALTVTLTQKYALDAFVADVEPGNPVAGTPDDWNTSDFENLIKELSAHFGKSNLAVSTFANMAKHPDALPVMHVAKPHVCMYAPQVYWFDNDPAPYVRTSLSSWRNAGIATPLVATAQSYWDLGEGTPGQPVMEAKVSKFIGDFANSDYGTIVGLNWYHAGGTNSSSSGAMSDSMIQTIAASRLNTKPFAVPPP
jgi:hypothetical protein